MQSATENKNRVIIEALYYHEYKNKITNFRSLMLQTK